ncbi:hypothetical protein OG601_46570 [Streptomyces sp. NBC_01239]|uniref:hypothetical protein n=1 Tax=Streptomyces sp. NBC_01239 TaxID=2903792 RepID=UPI0022508451|nr:hypothetical protein [Streptomyces sp. NBC_01239]MCX4818043.1 hypothetical protein [Streptomyces sp. NBC_01239]
MQAITHTFSQEASAVCFWEAATAGSADSLGIRTACYRGRLRARAAKAFSQGPSGFGTGFATPAASGAGSLPTFRRLQRIVGWPP